MTLDKRAQNGHLLSHIIGAPIPAPILRSWMRTFSSAAASPIEERAAAL
jgi:hypothetical protein